MRTHCEVKICGLTRRRDVELAVELGAEYVGFVLAPASPRHVPPELLPELARCLPEHVRRVGVFVNESVETIRRIAAGNLDVVQLHGAETPEFAARLGMPVWKAVHVETERELEMLERYDVERFLFDAASGGSGGVCDWHLAALAAKRWRIMLAGGLRSGNIRDAVETVKPYGVDPSSYLEEAPGIKSEDKMREFFKEIRK